MTIRSIDVRPLDVPLSDEFVISRGRVSRAEVAVVRAELDDGSEGFGEIAPFEPLTGERRDRSVEVARALAPDLVGEDAAAWADLAARLATTAPGEPAARCGLECAIADASARARAVPLWTLFGTHEPRALETDVTLPILPDDRLDALVEEWVGRGFGVLKVKVGIDRDGDAARVRRIAQRWPGVAFVLDANQGFSEDDTQRFVEALGDVVERVRLIEQPLPRGDLAGMARLRGRVGVPVAADESVFSLDDARAVVESGAADVINLKIMKSGLAASAAIAALARAHGLGLMVGGMVETRLAMSFSLALAWGIGGVDHVDLDTPLLMALDPWQGGYRYEGPRIVPWRGAGVEVRPAAAAGER